MTQDITPSSPNFSEMEERIFAMLENAENTQAQASALFEKITGVLERLEKSEGERTKTFAEAEHRASESEQARQKEWTAWKTEQTQLWQKNYQQNLSVWQTEQKQQWDSWQSDQVKAWQDWRTDQQSHLVEAIKTFNQSANAIVSQLDDKVRTVNLTQQSVNSLIQNGTAQAINTLVGEQLRQSVGTTLTGIDHHLSRTDSVIKASEDSAKRLKAQFIELESNAFDTLQTKIEHQVKTGIEQGLTAGLEDSTEIIHQSLTSVETKSIEIQNNLVSEFANNIKNATNEANTAKQSVMEDIYTSHRLVKDNSADCVQSLQQVKQVADKSVADVKEYHADLVNKGHWRWVAGWTALLTVLVTGAGMITYHVNKPDYAERDAVATEVETLLQQRNAIQNSYAMQKTKLKDGKTYVFVDKGDCIDSDYCKQREPTGYTTPTSQQLTPPKLTTQPSSQSTQNSQMATPTNPTTQSTYQPTVSGDGKNPYGNASKGSDDNPFGSSKSYTNPYRNP